MLLSAVSVLVVAQSSSEIPEGLMNNPVFLYFYSLRVSGIHVPIIRRKLLYLCDTAICHSVCVASGLLVGLNPTSRPDATHTEWQIPVSYRYRIAHLVGLICKIIVFISRIESRLKRSQLPIDERLAQETSFISLIRTLFIYICYSGQCNQ